MRTKLNTYPQIYHKKPTKISFSGQRLYTLSLLKTLPDGTKEKIPAFFSELKDIEDLQLLENIEKLWTDNTRYAKRIISNFRNKLNPDYIDFNFGYPKFFAIECPQFNNLNEKIRSLVEIRDFHFPHSYKIKWLQSASQIKSLTKLEGQGENMIGCIVKQAQAKDDYSSIKLVSNDESIDFYEKLGFKKAICSRYKHEYLVVKHNFLNIINLVEKKYGEILPVIKNGN